MNVPSCMMNTCCVVEIVNSETSRLDLYTDHNVFLKSTHLKFNIQFIIILRPNFNHPRQRLSSSISLLSSPYFT